MHKVMPDGTKVGRRCTEHGRIFDECRECSKAEQNAADLRSAARDYAEAKKR
jgi:hypothetical protein